MGDRPKNVLPDGTRTRASIVHARCQNCGADVEIRVPTVSVHALNHERERAEKAEEFLRAATGDEFALVPVASLGQIDQVVQRLSGWIEANVPGTTVYKHSGEVQRKS